MNEKTVSCEIKCFNFHIGEQSFSFNYAQNNLNNNENCLTFILWHNCCFSFKLYFHDETIQDGIEIFTNEKDILEAAETN